MSKHTLAEAGGFTPVIDSIVQQHSYMTALVFGVVWRHCKMASGRCVASQNTMAEYIGTSERTLRTH